MAVYYLGDKTEIEIPSGITAVGSYIFYGNKDITGVTLLDQITLIENSAFYGCSNLKTVKFSENVKQINNSAFCETGLESLTVPSATTKIGDYAFYGTPVTEVPLI